MRTITETYEEVKDSIQVSTSCRECGKTIRRTLTRSQTLSPWNQNTRSEIHVENVAALETDRTRFDGQSIKCSACTNPKLGLDVITKDDWDATKALRDEINEICAALAQKNREFEALFVGRHLPFNGRHVKVRYIYEGCFQGPFMRKDERGYLEKDEQYYPEKIFSRG